MKSFFQNDKFVAAANDEKLEMIIWRYVVSVPFIGLGFSAQNVAVSFFFLILWTAIFLDGALKAKELLRELRNLQVK